MLAAHHTLWFGWAAGTLGMLYNFPQIYHIYRRKSARDLSTTSLAIRVLSYGLYLAHGMSIEDPPTIYMTLGSLSQALILWAQKTYYNRRSAQSGRSSPPGDVELGLSSSLSSPRVASPRVVETGNEVDERNQHLATPQIIVP